MIHHIKWHQHAWHNKGKASKPYNCFIKPLIFVAPTRLINPHSRTHVPKKVKHYIFHIVLFVKVCLTFSEKVKCLDIHVCLYYIIMQPNFKMLLLFFGFYGNRLICKTAIQAIWQYQCWSHSRRMYNKPKAHAAAVMDIIKNLSLKTMQP